MALRISVDRTLPVPIGVQVKGQIEYGIASGALKPGTRLPSVRELAAAEGVAHVTVSHVYRALQRDGLIVVRPGKGTYVAGTHGAHPNKSKAELHRLVDAMVTRALKSGYRPAEISHMVTARLASGQAHRPLIALVGLFSHATEVYAREAAALLADLAPEIAPYTIDGLRASADQLERVRRSDMVLTIANRVREVQSLLGPDAPCVQGLVFVAHPDTVARLRVLPCGTRLGVISTFAAFLPTMLQGIAGCMALERPPLCAILSDTECVRAVLAQADAVVYASGSEAIRADVPDGKPAIEYLHTPEPSSVEAVRPLIERLSGLWPHANGHRRCK